ncbi:MAG: hypothetical protein ABH848_02795, partial [Candidatus Omnitrophota bacterium]
WVIPDDAVASAYVRVADARDGVIDPEGRGIQINDVQDISESFHIIGWFEFKEFRDATSHVALPMNDNYTVGDTNDDYYELSVASSYEIAWRWGGTITNVKLSYYIDGGGYGDLYNYQTNPPGVPANGIVLNGSGGGGPTSDTIYAWTIPDTISSDCKLKIANSTDSTSYGESAKFKIQGKFTLLTPAVALNDKDTPETNDDVYECRLITNEVHDVTWTTFGTIDEVDLTYSKTGDFTDELALKDALGQDADNIGNTGTFQWKIPNDRWPNTKIRIYDAGDHDVYVEGPVAAGGVSVINMDYVTITWDIRDLITNMAIEALVVDDDSGWQAPGLASPVSHDVPAGFWTASWTHQDYGTISQSYLVGWNPDAQTWDHERTIYRTMETLVVHIWRAYSEFAYDVDNDKLDVISWLERDGYLVSGAIIKHIKIYDGDYMVKSLTTLIDEANNKHIFYENVPDSVKLWVGDRSGEVRTVDNVLADCLEYKVGDKDIPSDFAGFFVTTWTPTAYTAGSTDYTKLQDGKVYAVTTYMSLPNGASFITPVSFTVSTEAALYRMEEIITTNVDTPLSTFALNMTNTLKTETGLMKGEIAAQTIVINTKMQEQTDMIKETTDTMVDVLGEGLDETVAVIDEKMDTMTGLVTDTMNEFTESMVSIETSLEDSAGLAKVATEILIDTAKQYSWSVDASPGAPYHGDNVIITVLGQPSLSPSMVIYDFDDTTIVSAALSDPSGSGMYQYNLGEIDERFTAGTSCTIHVTESETGAFITLSLPIQRYSWTSLVYPETVLVNDYITVQAVGIRGLKPTVTLYNSKAEIIMTDKLTELTANPGVYEFTTKANNSFDIGKAYTYEINISLTDTKLTGSGTVTGTTIDTIAGLASSAPTAAAQAKKAVDALAALSNVLLTNDGATINIALALKQVQNAVENFPSIMQKHGGGSVLAAALGDIEDTLNRIAGEEGYSMEEVIGKALSNNPTLKEVKQKTQAVGDGVKVLRSMFEDIHGIDDAVIISDVGGYMEDAEEYQDELSEKGEKYRLDPYGQVMDEEEEAGFDRRDVTGGNRGRNVEEGYGE